MSAQRKYFGTDGIRGHVGESLINPEFVLRLGWAAGKVLGGQKPGKVIIGKDTRVSGYIFESVLEAGLAAAGADVRLIGPMPTPAIAYLTRTLRADAGIVISASHNAYFDNGIKFFSGDGTKLDDDVEIAIEEKLDESMQMVNAGKLGKVKRYPDACGRYIEFCKSTFGNFNANLRGKKIVVDCANGATYIVAPRIFRELGAEVIELNVHPDGFNINENCGSTDPKILQRIVQAEQADLGIAFDGDGDRVIMVDHRGEVVDGDEILYIIAKHGFAQGALQGGVVGTVMSNLGFELALRKEGIDFVRAQVGDRYVLEQLSANGWQLGGETSGHVVHLGMTTTGDGIITSLQVLSAMVGADMSLFGMKRGMKKFPQVLVNVKISEKIEPQMLAVAQQAAKEFEKKLGENARVLLRPSGTEPLIRVMVEGENAELVEKAAHELAAIVKKNIGG